MRLLAAFAAAVARRISDAVVSSTRAPTLLAYTSQSSYIFDSSIHAPGCRVHTSIAVRTRNSSLGAGAGAGACGGYA